MVVKQLVDEPKVLENGLYLYTLAIPSSLAVRLERGNLLGITGISFSVAMVLNTMIAFFHVFGCDNQQGLELILFLCHLRCFVPKECKNICKF